jgi:hypothetical protein
LTAPSHLEDQIFIIRGRRVMLDSDLAAIYGVLPKRLNEQVKRNKARFPPDFLFRLTPDEVDALRPHSATSKPGRGGRRYQPYAFTEHGAVMLASVLNSPAAVAASIHVVRAFVRLREIVGIHKEPTAKLDALEAKYGQPVSSRLRSDPGIDEASCHDPCIANRISRVPDRTRSDVGSLTRSKRVGSSAMDDRTTTDESRDQIESERTNIRGYRWSTTTKTAAPD